jgi:hypothetical protein
MPRKKLASQPGRTTMVLKAPCARGVEELDHFLAELRTVGILKQGHRHLGFVGMSRLDFRVEFFEDDDAVEAMLRW